MQRLKGGSSLYLLDTNIISARINGNERIISKFDETISARKPISMNGVSHYEIKRGLFATNATRKLRDYEILRQDIQMLFLDTEAVFEKAAEIHVDLKRRGSPIPDADILIAATALTRNMVLVSDDSHFQWIQALTVENWLRE